MFIELACPSCGRPFKVGREHIGKRGKCKCGQLILIEEPEAVVELAEAVPEPPLPPEPEPFLPPDIIPQSNPRKLPEKPKGFWATMKEAANKASEAAAKAQRDQPVIYFGGPFDLKAKSDGILTLDENELIFKSSFLRREFFRIPYSAITGAHLDTAERLGKLRTLGALALAGPFAAVFVGFGIKKKDKFLKLDFQDGSDLAVTVIFGKASFGPDMDSLSGKILARRRESVGKVTAQSPSHTDGAPAESATQEDVATLLEKLALLREKGILTEDEFQKKKAELLSRL